LTPHGQHKDNWNKPPQPSTNLNAHMIGQAESGNNLTAIGEIWNSLIDFFWHGNFDELIKIKDNQIVHFISDSNSSPISA
jgi:hypothetical protein